MDKKQPNYKAHFNSVTLPRRIQVTKKSVKEELKEPDYYIFKNVTIDAAYLLEIIERAELAFKLQNQKTHIEELAVKAENLEKEKVILKNKIRKLQKGGKP